MFSTSTLPIVISKHLCYTLSFSLVFDNWNTFLRCLQNFYRNKNLLFLLAHLSFAYVVRARTFASPRSYHLFFFKLLYFELANVMIPLVVMSSVQGTKPFNSFIFFRMKVLNSSLSEVFSALNRFIKTSF